MRYFLFFLFCLLVMFSNGQKINEGVAGLSHRIFNYETGQFVVPKYYKEYKKIWYRDSAVIIEAISVYSTKDINGVEKWRIEVDHYTYIDLRTLSLYDYPAFSADSMFTRKYFHSDSVVKNFPPWNFYSYRNTWLPVNTVFIADTVINNITYKRIKGTLDLEGFIETDIGYIRCDKKNSLFHFDKAWDEKLGCPVTKVECMIPGMQRRSYVEVVFLSDTLTNEEKKVFDAWERNAKLYPVK